MSEASADSAVSQGPTLRPPRKYSDVDEFDLFAYTNPIVSTTIKYRSMANSTQKSPSTMIGSSPIRFDLGDYTLSRWSGEHGSPAL